jgi:hypothetical protein
MLRFLNRNYKTFTKEEVLKPFFNRSYKNLFEMAGKYKNQGIGLRFYRKTWPENTYFTLTRIKFDDMRHGKAWGILTWEGKTRDKEELIKSALKLGTWKYIENKENKA